MAQEEPGITEGSIPEDAIVREVRIDAPPEVVFGFFTDPEQYVRWKGVRADLNPQEGGRYEVDVGPGVTRGEFVELSPPNRVVFTWGWEDNEAVPPGSSTVEVDLIPDGDGTLLRLLHRGLPTEEERQQHGGGWDVFLPRLATLAGGGDPGPNPLPGREE